MERIQYGDLDLNLLLVLDRLLDRESVTEAAADLGLSQSATSRALQRLRDALGDPLLVRAGRRLVPTDRARTLREPVQRALEAHRAVFAAPEAFDPAAATGTFVVGLGDELHDVLLAPLVRALRAVASGIDLRLHTLGPSSVDLSRRGLLDLALAPDLRELPAIAGAPDLTELVQRPAYTRRFRVVGARDRWPDPPDLATYLEADHVIVSFETGGRGFVDDLLAVEGHERRVAVSVPSFSASVDLVARTGLLALLPGEIAAHRDDVVVHPPPFEVPPLPMLLLWHPRDTTSARQRFLRGVFTEVVRDVLVDRPDRTPPGSG